MKRFQFVDFVGGLIFRISVLVNFGHGPFFTSQHFADRYMIHPDLDADETVIKPQGSGYSKTPARSWRDTRLEDFMPGDKNRRAGKKT